MLIPMSELKEKYGVSPKGVLHVGAHIGEEADAYAAAGVERVIWVEPHPDALPSLWKNVGTRAGHIVIPRAACETDGEKVKLYKTSNICSSSLLPLKKHKEKHPDVGACGTVSVETVRIDSIFKTILFKPSDFEFLNMDIQGAELIALKGAHEYLKSCKWIYTEVNEEELYEGCVLTGYLEYFLNTYGFKLAEKRLFSATHGWGDALFVRK